MPILIAAVPLLVSNAAWNPFNWSSATYLIAIAIVLLLHRLVPRDGAWYVRLGRETLLITPAVFLYFAVRGLMDAHEREPEAIRNADMVIGLQESIGIFHEPALQQRILESSFLVDLMNWIYIWGHWPVVVGTLVWLIIWRPEASGFYRNAFLLSGVLAMFVFATFPVAPPRLMPDMAVVDTVTQQSQSYRVLQPPALTNPFAAMPSLHFGWNLLMGIAIVRESRLQLARVFGYAIPLGMFLAIILTANHYFLDGIAGGALVLGTLGILAVWSEKRPLERVWSWWRSVESGDDWDAEAASIASTYVSVAPGMPRSRRTAGRPAPRFEREACAVGRAAASERRTMSHSRDGCPAGYPIPADDD
jgi:hypothetical protein